MRAMKDKVESCHGQRLRAVFCSIMFSPLLGSPCGCTEPIKVGYPLGDCHVTSAVFTPGNKYIVAGGSKRISLVDFRNCRTIDRFPDESPQPGTPATFPTLTVSPDGKLIAAVVAAYGAPTRIVVYDLETG